MTECDSLRLFAVFMVLIKSVRFLFFVTPLLCGAPGQPRPVPAHPNTATPQNSKAHDKNWLKSQVRRRYGTSALPEKADPNPSDKKTEPGKNAKQTSAKN
jgi:hypothetical protein